MLILLALVAVGVLASIWGFMMCFLPTRWGKLTETISIARRWTEPAPKRLPPLVRFGNRVGGLRILAGGCWFTYMATSEIYSVLAKRTAGRAGLSVVTELPNSPTPGVTVLSIILIFAGILMAIFPGRALAIFQRAWPAERSVSASAAPKIVWLVRLCGFFFPALAAMAFLR